MSTVSITKCFFAALRPYIDHAAAISPGASLGSPSPDVCSNNAHFQESHLQDAILAQQASTSGVRVDNHVIPTPKVFPVDAKHYDEVYPVQPPPPKNSLIKVQGS